MKCVRMETIDTPIAHAVEAIATRLRKGKNVAWFLSGGSAIDLEVRIAKRLHAGVEDTSRLLIGLIDERYGALGHMDENYTKLIKAGFPLPIDGVLNGQPPEITSTAFGERATQILAAADFSLGIFGVGTDGHTAGIKPNSLAVSSTAPAVIYDWKDYRRITLTPPTIRRFDKAIIYALGSDKSDTLTRLVTRTIPLEEQPAQVLKDIRTSTLYKDISLDGVQ